MYSHTKLLKKSQIGWRYVVGAIVALLIMAILFYIAFESKGDMSDLIQKIKDII